MINRQETLDGIARYERYQLKNQIDIPIGHEALRYCFRYIKRGISCGLIVSDMKSVAIIMRIVEGYCKNLTIIKRKQDGFIFKEGAEFRVLPRINEHLAYIMLGKDAKIIQARDGDPKMKKFKKIMGL